MVKVRQHSIDKVKAASRTAMMRMGKNSQDTFAHAIEIAPSTLSNFLNGKNVATSTFQLICEKLNLNWEEIYERENHEISPSSNSPIIEIPTFPPPSTALEYPECSVALNSPFYVYSRSKQLDWCQEISKPGALIRIKAPEQMGKTSLIIRILHQAEKQGDRIVYISLKEADRDCFKDLDKFYRWFCASISRKLKLDNKFNDYWEDNISCNLWWRTYF